MGSVLFTDVMVLDASGADRIPGEVLVQGNRIRTVAKGRNQIAREQAATVDRRPGHDPDARHGRGPLPSLLHRRVDALPARHDPARGAHAQDRGQRQAAPGERLHQHLLRRLGQAAPRRGRCATRSTPASCPGPRMRAASPELVATGGLGDERQLHLHRESFALIADGPEEIRRAVRTCIREGVDNIKLNVSGDDFYPHAPAGCTTYMDDEVQHGLRDRARVRQAGRHPFALGQQRQALGPQRRRLHLSLRVRRRGGARHDGGGQGPDLPRSGRRPAAQHGLRGRALGHHARGGRADGHARAISRRPPRSMPRSRSAASGWWSAATTASPGRRRAPMPATSSISSTCSATRRWRPCICATRYGGELMRMGGELGQVREGYPRRPAAGRRQSAAQDIGDHGRPQPVRHDHEGRRDLQGPARPMPVTCGSRRSRNGRGRTTTNGAHVPRSERSG